MNRSSPQPKALFAIELKINDQILNIEVLQREDRHSLTDRICRENQIGWEFKKALEDKIVQALLKISQKQTIGRQLREKVEKFIKKEEPTNHHRAFTLSTEPINPSDNSLSSNSPPKDQSPPRKEKVLQPSPKKENFPIELPAKQQSSSKPQSSLQSSPNPNRHLYCNQNNIEDSRRKPSLTVTFQNRVEQPKQTVQKPLMVVVAGERKPAIRKQRNINKNQAAARVSTISSQQNERNKKRCDSQFDEDLVKAYKVVLAKCKDAQMKEMAKRFLDSLNQPKEQKRSRSSSSLKKSPNNEQKQIKQRASSHYHGSSSPAQKPTIYERPSIPHVSSFTSADQRTRRLMALQQDRSYHNYESQIDHYIDERREPYERKHRQTAKDREVQPTPRNQLYDKKYSRQAIQRSPYEYLFRGQSGQLGSTANLKRSYQSSPFHHPSSFQPTLQVNQHKSSQNIRRFRYLQE